jgi:DNA uptake protein ComE-like DNA-binding protein
MAVNRRPADIFAAMPTPAERKALLFLAGVIVLGASVRVVRAARGDGASDVATRHALSRQLAAVDSAQSSAGNRKGTPTRRAGRKSRGRSLTRVDSTARTDSGVTVRAARGRSTLRPRRDTSSTPVGPIDLDVASEADIEQLPRIGPVLARRIVEDRTANGAFGSLAGFERVRGVGPSLAASVRDRVTFSGTARPSNAIVESRLSATAARSTSRRRERRR